MQPGTRFLVCAVIGLLFTLNALSSHKHTSVGSVLSFFAGWFTSELALHHIAWQALCVAGFVALGDAHAWQGKLALAITAISWAGLLRCHWLAHQSSEVFAAALPGGLGGGYLDAIKEGRASRVEILPVWRRAIPFPVRHGNVEVVRDVVYHDDGRLKLRLDVHRKRGGHPAKAPVLLYVHGGAWVLGSKRHQGLPLLHHLAASGWVGFSINYRLSPRATFPDHVIDVKRAIAWVRAHAVDYGADPDFIVIAGGSAGGHLAALAALTPDRKDWQPGFETADVRVQGCIAIYGVYDFTNRFGHWPTRPLDQRLIGQQVFKATLAQAPALYDDASPMSHVRADAPPFLIVHGEQDSLVPVEDARRFEQLLRNVSTSPVVYAELPGAQHAFEIFPSRRTKHWLTAVDGFVHHIHARAGENARDVPIRDGQSAIDGPDIV